jgi:hypothetical protein
MCGFWFEDDDIYADPCCSGATGGMNSPLKGARGGFMSHSPSSMEVVEGAAQ